MTRIKFVGDALLIPFFLISVGMLIDVGVLFSSLSLWGMALVFTALVVVGKTAAAKATQLVLRQSAEEGWTVAGLTIPQAAATLAVTLVGFDVGLFDEAVVNAVVVMILLTSMLGPSLVERFGRAVALQEAGRTYRSSEAPQRILVPLANPETAPALMDVAMAIRDPRAEQPLYPLAIARSGPDEEAAVAASEGLLAHAVVHAAAADTPVVPLTRVDHNVARGIRRAVRERRISTVIIGWNGVTTARARVFGSVLDQFLEEDRSMVLVSRLLHPLAATLRVLLLVPPFAEREVGFGPALAAIKAMASRAGMTLHLVGLRDSDVELREWVARTEPEVAMRSAPLDSWTHLLPALDKEVREGDLLCLLSVRRGALAWRPDLLPLPRQLAARFPEHDFITVYLAEPEPFDAVEDSITAGAALPDLPTRHVTLGIADGSLPEVLARVLAPGFAGEPERAAQLGAEIARQQAEYAPELAPGLVLYHLHTTAVTGSHLFLGVGEAPLEGLPTSGPVRAVLVLLAPLSLEPSRYLRQLALTARLVHREGVVEQLVRAATPEEARRFLLGPAGEHPIQVN